MRSLLPYPSVRLVLMSIGAFVLLSCGNDASSTLGLRPPPGGIPACANVTATVPRPPSFPTDFPLPPGTVLFKQEVRTDNRTIIYAVAPYDFATMQTFMEQALPRAGYKLSGGEAEEGREAESFYAGHNIRGRWVLHPVTSCPNTSSLTVLAAK
ncbi:MAG: hypothetical protein NVS2B7_34840 [Herpetosiphon sp.]